MKRVLQIYRDGQKHEPFLETPLLDGEQGNLQTLQEMAEIVRFDRTQPDLRAFVLREIVGNVKGHDFKNEIKKCFEFAQKNIVYRKDPVGVERVSDIWSTMYALNPNNPEGDCGIKSVFLATCLALIGHRPCFIVLRDQPTAKSFNHVYCGLVRDGEVLPLDPTPEDKPIGYEAEALEKAFYQIF